MNNMSKEEKAAAKEEYYAHKNKLMKLEKENYTRLYILRCYDGWYKLLGHSAVFLAKYISPKIDKNYNLTEDRDYNDVSEHGIVTIPASKIDNFKTKMEKAGLKLARDFEYGYEYELNERITEEDFIRMLHEDELMTERANKLVMSKERIPLLRASTKALLETVHADVRKQDTVAREVFLNDMEKQAVRADVLTIAAARGVVRLDKCLVELTKIAEILYEYAAVMSDMRLIVPKRYYNMVLKIKDFEKEIEREARNRALKKADKVLRRGKVRKAEENGDLSQNPGAEAGGDRASDTTNENKGSKEEKAKERSKHTDEVAAE